MAPPALVPPLAMVLFGHCNFGSFPITEDIEVEPFQKNKNK